MRKGATKMSLFVVHFYRSGEQEAVQLFNDIDEALNQVVKYDEEDVNNKAELFEV